MKFMASIPSLFVFLSSVSIEYNTQKEPVQWRITMDSASGNIRHIRFDASVSPGWHLYSQYIEEGGPIPTEFIFREESFIAIGKPSEEGKRVTFHDEIYGMDISWYADRVTFIQKLELTNQVTSIDGFIEYMTCSGDVCVPAKKQFSVPVGFNRK
jgi:DsbC/DsbD-like thiol-disulfide interchange protein